MAGRYAGALTLISFPNLFYYWTNLFWWKLVTQIAGSTPASYDQTSQCTLERSFAGPFPSGDYIMVVIDEFSRFPEVELLTSTSAKAVIPKLDAMFARQGVPDILKSDNGFTLQWP